MTAPSQPLRRGLPRIPGGEPWPPSDAAAPEPEVLPNIVESSDALQSNASPAVESAPVQPTPASASGGESRIVEAAAPSVPVAGGTLRRGLPRVPGGDPWPPEGTVASVQSAAPAKPAEAAPVAAPAAAAVDAPIRTEAAAAVDAVATPTPTAPEAAAASTPAAGAPRTDLRQGLPRIAGGEPWPPKDAFPAVAANDAVVAEPADQIIEAAAPVPAQPLSAPEHPEPVLQPAAQSPEPKQPAVAVPAAAAATPTPDTVPTRSGVQPSAPQTVPPAAARTSRSAAPAAAAAKTKSEPVKHGPFTTKQWALAAVLGAFCALGMATAVVLLARWFTGFETIENFIARYPGEYELPVSAPVGIPAWLAWNHFFNFFLMVLIIRSGLLVRHQQKPPAYWSSKRSPKVSINLWLHQSLDVLWLVNGLVFVVVLFASGHWMRIVPTSWEVFPNAISAALQYMTLDWPVENGWVNYNALQQLAYFATVFLAAPLAAVTGYRLSAFWPKSAAGLTKAFPIEVARKLHFPTMLYFVVFIVIHVVLVLTTGALRNLNHMYAAQGSVDPAEYADNPLGLILFAVSLLVIAGAWIACRPMILSPVAQLFGKVSSR